MRDDELFSHVESARPRQASDDPVPMAVFLAADDAAPVQDGPRASATVTPVTSATGASRGQRRFERRAQARRLQRPA